VHSQCVSARCSALAVRCSALQRVKRFMIFMSLVSVSYECYEGGECQLGEICVTYVGCWSRVTDMGFLRLVGSLQL